MEPKNRFRPFENVGRKLQTIAEAFAWLFFTGGIVTTIVGLATIGDNDGICLAIGIGTAVLAFPSNWVLYGFGRLIENVDILAGQAPRSAAVQTQPIAYTPAATQPAAYTPPLQADPFAGPAQPMANEAAIYKNGICDFCEAEKPVAQRKLVSWLGTRYRDLCDDCYANWQAQSKNKSEL